MIDADLFLEDFKSSSTDNYVKIRFNKELFKETLFTVNLTVAGTEYPFSVTLISERAAANADGTQENKVISGKDWANSLTYDEPKLLAWNDETGTKEVIETGGQYTMSQRDVLAVYCPAEHYVTTGSPIEFVPGFTIINNFWRIEYVLPSESQTINLEVEVMDDDEQFATYNYVITTP